MTAAATFTPAERRAVRRALYDWLATYAHGVRPDGYADARAVLARMLREDEERKEG